jgi:deoxyribonuclease-4
MAEAIDRVHARVPGREASIALETTAGQGTILGHRFEQIAAILARLGDPGRAGVCLDTCHVFAAGYDLRTPAAYAETMRRFAGEIGFDRLIAVHVNDSKQGLGSRVDRHEHIGRGHLGLESFRSLMNDARLVRVPLVLETPKGEDGREDVANLARLVGLVADAPRNRRPAAFAGAGRGRRPAPATASGGAGGRATAGRAARSRA